MSLDVHPACQDPDVLLRDCNLQRTRGSGPGGQHRNKVETMVRLKHRPTGVVAEAGERRRQSENRALAVFRLRVKLAVAIRCQPAAAPSELWQSRCRAGRLAVNPGHADFPALLAQALDTLAAHDWDLKPAAAHLDCTASQLVKFLKLEPAAFVQVNAMRAERDMHPLR